MNFFAVEIKNIAVQLRGLLRFKMYITLSIHLWKVEPEKPNPFSPVQRARKFSAVLERIHSNVVLSMRICKTYKKSNA